MSRIPWQPKHTPGPRPGSPGAKRCGQALRQRYDHADWVQFGQLGGVVNKLVHGTEGLAAAGRKGGAALLADRGPEYFAELGQRSAQLRAAKRRHLQQQRALSAEPQW
jgi:hypothetical protein